MEDTKGNDKSSNQFYMSIMLEMLWDVGIRASKSLIKCDKSNNQISFIVADTQLPFWSKQCGQDAHGEPRLQGGIHEYKQPYPQWEGHWCLPQISGVGDYANESVD